ncbi:ABC transporter substrate-binding protein [Streptomyces daliensis]|uniref:ABC transporter substrate-binding protein n=1 Tax=Streptomyces daliensis TaxID=299421 RepID=A0A8T4ISS9_9ACTN|nr:ABC transporter substrate-binding protein [Streptomyces daliensis]
MKALHRPKAVTLLAVSALALASCSGASGSDQKSEEPVKGGKLTYAVNAEPVNLDPHASAQDVTGLFARPVLDSLVSMDAKGTIRPWLASSWKISEDQKTYSFTLRKGVRFTDGTPFDAEAVKANLDHIVDPKTKSEMAAGYIEPYEGTKVTGERTLEVSFSRPHSPFLNALSTAYFGMQSPEQLEKGADALAKKLVGTGPFVMKDFTPREGITYTRNDQYAWGPAGARHKGPAHLKELEFTVLTEDSARLGALTGGQAHAVANVPPAAVEQVEASPDLRMEKRQAPGGAYTYYPNTEKGPFKDARVRQAFRDGIDFETVVEKLYFGVFAHATNPLSPATPGYDKRAGTHWRHNPKKAAALLDEAGWTGRDSGGYRTKDGKRLTVTWPFVKAANREQRSTLAEQIQAEAKDLGFELVLDTGTQHELAADYGKGEYDVMDLSWQRADGDALRNLFSSASIATPEKFGQNASRLDDERVDEWLGDALATTDAKKRAALYAKVQRQVTNEAAAFPVYVVSYLMGASENAQGIDWDPQAYPTFYDAWVTDQ